MHKFRIDFSYENGTYLSVKDFSYAIEKSLIIINVERWNFITYQNE